MMDFYIDAPHRYRHDAEFKHAVDALVYYARAVGATPNELRQIAGFAALKIEMELARPAYALGFGSWWVCPNRTVSSTLHSIGQQLGVCQGCNELLVELPLS